VSSLKATRLAACVLGLWSVVFALPASLQAKPSPGASSEVKDQEITGDHRGYTNDQLFLRVGDEKEMKFVVRIPGDKDEKWHKDFQINSRITVTYHQSPGDKLPVATAIRAAK